MNELEPRESNPRVVDFVDQFADALKAQLLEDEKRWGDTWIHRPREGQEARTMKDYQDWFDQFKHGGNPMPWLQVAGDALICWVREQYPEIQEKYSGEGTA